MVTPGALGTTLTVTIKTRPGWRWLMHPVTRVLAASLLVVGVVAGVVFIHYYNVYAAVIDRRLSAPIFNQTSIVLSGPKVVHVGEALTPDQFVGWLDRAGYSANQASPVGTFTIAGDIIAIHPGPEAYRAPTPARVEFQNGTVSSITDTSSNSPLANYALEPELLTSLFNQKREKRRLVDFSDLPPMLINAVIDTEDRDYFHHGAVDWWRVPVAAWRDVRNGGVEQGASTITMQTARNIFPTLGFQRTFRRKAEETIVATELEERLTKEQIFELYANQIYMGQRGSYSIHGFGEAADAFFGKSVGQLTLPECALLAGIIHAPNFDSPYLHPGRALRRRNKVLDGMARYGAITPAQMEAAIAAPLHLQPANDEATDAPYFVDMVRDRLARNITEHDLTTQSYRIYTTLDPDLQAAASSAVVSGMKIVDKELAALRAAHRPRHAKPVPQPRAQVALIALDPHTGAVLALIGGRNYAFSQLNHALAERPTGSIFKPFVYATALDTGLLPNLTPITETSTVMDQPTTFEGGYQPANFEHKYYGQVTLRTALEHSLNNATITLAEEVGLQAVTDLAHEAGIVNAQPTPSEAIGTYDATPLTMAGAYTIFANGGLEEQPWMTYAVRARDGSVVYQQPHSQRQVLDPRIAFLTTNLMESVLQSGTAVRVRESGYDAPAAGKTGSSHDAWFAGYTSNLLCIVWVGLDNYDNLNIEGAHAALPIWTAFMKAALKLPTYANPQPFTPPPGIVAVKIDTVSHDLATPLCPPSQVETDYYLDGTQPKVYCPLHPSPLHPGGVIANTLRFFHIEPPPPPPAAPVSPAASRPRAMAAAPPPPAPAKPTPKKRGFFGKLLHALGGGGGTPH